jgi:hypothetical protein
MAMETMPKEGEPSELVEQLLNGSP